MPPRRATLGDQMNPPDWRRTAPADNDALPLPWFLKRLMYSSRKGLGGLSARNPDGDEDDKRTTGTELHASVQLTESFVIPHLHHCSLQMNWFRTSTVVLPNSRRA